MAQYWVVCDAAERGAACVHLMWGTPTYKGRLGATPRPATMLSVFRHQGSRLWSLDEAACAAKARHPRAAERYEAARRAARRTAASAKRRAVSSWLDGEDTTVTITQPTTASPEGTLVFPDLRATVYLASVPNGLAEEIDQLYSSLFTTMDWFASHDDAKPTGACVLAQPRHVLLFYVKGDTVEVLNKAFEIAPQDARRACTALFRAVPRARRIHLEVMFPPAELRLPCALATSPTT